MLPVEVAQASGAGVPSVVSMVEVLDRDTVFAAAPALIGDSGGEEDGSRASASGGMPSSGMCSSAYSSW